MNEKQIYYVVCTEHTIAGFEKKSQTHQFFKDNNLVCDTDYKVFFNNKKGLSQNYNTFLNVLYKDKIIVFIHDDIILGYNAGTLKRELNLAHQQYDIVGLAGATKINLSSPTLWHIMQRGMSGSVGHSINGMNQMTNFGPSPARCIVLDGLFLSVDVTKVINANHKFDEQFTFHHYDLSFTIDADKKGLKCGTWPLWVTHISPGLRSLDDINWKKSSDLFCKKYDIT